MTKRYCSKICSRSPVRSFPGPDWQDGSAAPWTLPWASHPAVTSDARQDREQALDTGLGRVTKPPFRSTVPLKQCDLVSHQPGWCHRCALCASPNRRCRQPGDCRVKGSLPAEPAGGSWIGSLACRVAGQDEHPDCHRAPGQAPGGLCTDRWFGGLVAPPVPDTAPQRPAGSSGSSDSGSGEQLRRGSPGYHSKEGRPEPACSDCAHADCGADMLDSVLFAPCARRRA
jgi:hypothetical protein